MLFRSPRRRDHRFRGHAAQRRDEGPDYRQRRPEYPHPGDHLAKFKKTDIGDIVGVEGEVFKTKREVMADESVQPVPWVLRVTIVPCA